MSKELEALEIIKNITIIKDFEDENGIKRVVFASEVYKEPLEIIETALKELEFYKKRDKQFKQDVDNLIDKLKALEIIKEKAKLYTESNLPFGEPEIWHLYVDIKGWLHGKDKEKYDILKEVLL